MFGERGYTNLIVVYELSTMTFEKNEHCGIKWIKCGKLWQKCGKVGLGVARQFKLLTAPMV